MSQLLRIQGEVFHIPSIARMRLFSSPFLGRPCVKIVNHDGHEFILRYKLNEWNRATHEYKKMETARSSCYEALKKIPLLEEEQMHNPLMESERKMT